MKPVAVIFVAVFLGVSIRLEIPCSMGHVLDGSAASAVVGGDPDHEKCAHTDFGFGTDPCAETVWCSSPGICEENIEHDRITGVFWRCIPWIFDEVQCNPEDEEPCLVFWRCKYNSSEVCVVDLAPGNLEAASQFTECTNNWL